MSRSAGIFFMFLSLMLVGNNAFADIASAAYASDADNLTAGTVDVQRLPVGDSATTVAAGNDVRFNSLPYGRPTDLVDNSRVLVWVE